MSIIFLLHSLLRGRETDGFQLGMEKFIRDAIKEFPYHESQLLQEIVRNIASTSPVRVNNGNYVCGRIV